MTRAAAGPAALRVERLANHPHFIATLAGWHFAQWGELTGASSGSEYERLLAAGARGTGIPTVLIALTDRDLVGSATLLASDMETRPELTPWLAQVFVAPEHRRRGIGSALVRAIVGEAFGLGVGRLYLYTTEDRQGFYGGLGWVLTERVHYKGKDRVIMTIEPESAAASTVTIRRAQADDAAELTRVAHAAKRHWGYAEELLQLWRDDLTVTPAAIADDVAWCAVRAGRILGFYVVSGSGPTRELEHMWVVPDAMGAGIGARLLRHAIDTLRTDGASVLRIAADPNAEGFYLKIGARRVGEVPSTPEGRMLPLLELSLR